MSDAFDPRDDLTERLVALGRQPVDPALQSRHLTAMAGVRTSPSFGSLLASRVKLGVAVLGGFLLGATGLATAGAMGPLQPIAKTTVEAVTPFELPDDASDKAKAAKAGAKAKAAKVAEAGADADAGAPKYWGDDCVDAYGTENRGQYLKNAKDDAEDPTAFATARESDCGKALSAVKDGDAAATEDEGADGGKSAERRKDAAATDRRPSTDAEGAGNGERGGRSGVTSPPESTPVTPDPAESRSQGADRAGGRAPSGDDTAAATDAES